ncbi:MAG: hypothetical protein KDE27_21050, partial [Planctomycetes bacterium]|nr:hypothetical protein [Planctomycetota bacterium]
MAISRRLGGAALAFAAGFASAARAQDPAAVIRAALGTDAIAVVVVPDPPAARAALTAAIGSLPDDLPAEVRAFAGLGLLALRRALGGSLAEFVQTVAAGGAAFGLAVDPVDADETAGAPLLLLAVRPGDPDAAYERLAHLPAHVRCERAGELLLLS